MKLWQEQLRNSPRTIAEFETYFPLSSLEKEAIATLNQQGGLPLRVTPYFLSLINPHDLNDPLRLQIIPRQAEFKPADLERRDPTGDEEHEVVPHLIHRYPDRVLLFPTDRCASYCLFCFLKRLVGQGPSPKLDHLKQALDYIAARSSIKEVILSGGDPLLLEDSKIEVLLQSIRAIPSVELIRFHTRILTFAPMRITEELVYILKKYQPVFIVTHFNHPNEISPVTESAILKLADNGFSVLNQNVLLKGINDNRDTLEMLFRKLTRLRVRPYYLHQCDLATGTEQFRVPLPQALELVQSLRGHLSGLCLPTFVIDIPGGFGKVPMFKSPIVAQNTETITLRGFLGEQAEYPLK